MKKFLQQAGSVKITSIFFAALLIAYFCFIHSPLKEWHQLKKNHQQLSQQIEQLSSRPDPANPLQHDPLIHMLIKFAQLNQLEIVSVQFNKAQTKKEIFSCELRGSYFNIKNFIKNLFDSSYTLSLKELRMRNEAKLTYLKSSLVFEHEF